jgi:hypothetical protein
MWEGAAMALFLHLCGRAEYDYRDIQCISQDTEWTPFD